jgi:hypothetical protein
VGTALRCRNPSSFHFCEKMIGAWKRRSCYSKDVYYGLCIMGGVSHDRKRPQTCAAWIGEGVIAAGSNAVRLTPASRQVMLYQHVRRNSLETEKSESMLVVRTCSIESSSPNFGCWHRQNRGRRAQEILLSCSRSNNTAPALIAR